jgi:hypothetical protein
MRNCPFKLHGSIHGWGTKKGKKRLNDFLELFLQITYIIVS